MELELLKFQKSIKDIISKPSESSQENTEIKKEITQPKEKKTETRKDRLVTQKQRTEVTYDFSRLINEKDELGTSLILDFGDLQEMSSQIYYVVEITINDEIEAGNEYLIDVKNNLHLQLVVKITQN